MIRWSIVAPVSNHRRGGNALAANTIAHRAGLVEAEQSVSVIDKQVEVSEEALAENPSNARIGRLNRSQVLNYSG